MRDETWPFSSQKISLKYGNWLSCRKIGCVKDCGGTSRHTQKRKVLSRWRTSHAPRRRRVTARGRAARAHGEPAAGEAYGLCGETARAGRRERPNTRGPGPPRARYPQHVQINKRQDRFASGAHAARRRAHSRAASPHKCMMTDARSEDPAKRAVVRLGNLYVTQNPERGMHATEFQQMVYDLVCLRDNALHVEIDVSQLCTAICAQYYTLQGTEPAPTAWLSCEDFVGLAQTWQQVQETAVVGHALCGGVLSNLHTPGLIEAISHLRTCRRSAANGLADPNTITGANKAIAGVAVEQEEQMREFTDAFKHSHAVVHAASKRMHEKPVPRQVHASAKNARLFCASMHL